MHRAAKSSGPRTLVEKVAQKFSVEAVTQGAFVSIRPHAVMTHDNTGPVISKFDAIGAQRVHDNKQIVFTLDHDVQNKSAANLNKYKRIEAFAKKHSIDFYPAGHGIGHQIMVEEGYAFPQTLAVASDSHSNMYGGIGCLGTPIVRTDAAAIWATGQTWWQVPSVAQVEFLNKLQPGVTGKDVIVTLCSLFNKDQVLNCAVEFTGKHMDSLSIDDRLTIANMTTEWGALAGLFPVDDVLLEWMEQRLIKLEKLYPRTHPRINKESLAKLQQNVVRADADAPYAKKITLDLATVSPYVSGPNSVKVATSLRELEEQKIAVNKAYLVSCTNSRASDIKQAAEVVKGKKIAPGVEFYIAAASKNVQQEAEVEGDWQLLLDAGAKPLPAGCGPCIGLGVGLLKEGEVGISATNRNYKGRMGDATALAYLASPAVVAASAISGYISSPLSIGRIGPSGSNASEGSTPQGSFVEVPFAKKEAVKSELVDGFPSVIEGELIFCNADNLNTDGIYPGKYTYQDLSNEEMAKVAMENYDPDFSKLVQTNDILVSGLNFGTGSSREQAATCLLYRGIRLVVVSSCSQTFKRNAINNGLLVMEAPKLVQDLRKAFEGTTPKGTTPRTARTRMTARADFEQCTLTVDGREYEMQPLGKFVQELVTLNGLENWTRGKIDF